MINDYDDRLLQIEQMIERGEVYAKYNKNRPKKKKVVRESKVQEPKVRKPRVTYDHITNDMIMAVFSHTKTWEQMGKELNMTPNAVRQKVRAMGIRKTGVHTLLRVTLPTKEEFIALANAERSWLEIAAIYNLSTRTLREYAKRIGLVKERKPRTITKT
jgi:hypothetical protein